MADKLIEEMGIGHLLEDNPCQRSSSVYSPAVDGWKNGIAILKKYVKILNMHKIVDIKFSGHNTFLGLPSAGTLKIERYESQII